MKDLKNEIIAYALKNAIEYGKTDASKILTKLFQHGLERESIGKIMSELQKTAEEVNKMDENERKKKFEFYKKYVIEREEKDKGLPEIELDGLKKVVTRLAPEPSKYNHIGHALTFIINYLYAKKYNGKCLLRFEDANPEKVAQEYVDAMIEDVIKYLGIKVDEIRYVSDDMDILYNYAEKLIKKGEAYMCFCDREKMQKFRHVGKECECRQKDSKINLKEWQEFLKGKYMKGEAVLRIKGEMKSPNHVMRDSVIFRAIESRHYRQGNKYKVWPMYDFYNPIEDSLMGVTLVLRSNEFEQRVELQDYIKKLLGLKKQIIVQYGRFNVIDYTTKGREIRELIESKELMGWDDPRLITIRALKRRGIVKESFFELANELGLKKGQVNLEFDLIAAINRKIIDKKADRYYFVSDPIKLDIKDAPKIRKISIPVHPDKKEKRELNVDEIYISKEDINENRGKEIRLLHLFNGILAKEGNKMQFTSTENKNIQKVHWVSDFVKTKILMPDGNWNEGYADTGIKNLKEGDIVQFERFGFCRFDRICKGIYEFWFAHK